MTVQLYADHVCYVTAEKIICAAGAPIPPPQRRPCSTDLQQLEGLFSSFLCLIMAPPSMLKRMQTSTILTPDIKVRSTLTCKPARTANVLLMAFPLCAAVVVPLLLCCCSSSCCAFFSCAVPCVLLLRMPSPQSPLNHCAPTISILRSASVQETIACIH